VAPRASTTAAHYDHYGSGGGCSGAKGGDSKWNKWNVHVLAQQYQLRNSAAASSENGFEHAANVPAR
jgi:hypothetical protein